MSSLTDAEQAAYEALVAVYGGSDHTDVKAARAVVAAVRDHIIAEALGDHETEHIVEFEETTFGLQHPLSERLDGSLFDCQLHGRLRGLSGPPMRSGRYRVIEESDHIRFESLKEPPYAK